MPKVLMKRKAEVPYLRALPPFHCMTPVRTVGPHVTLLWGRSGTGKTLYAHLLGRIFLDKGWEVRYFLTECLRLGYPYLDGHSIAILSDEHGSNAEKIASFIQKEMPPNKPSLVIVDSIGEIYGPAEYASRRLGVVLIIHACIQSWLQNPRPFYLLLIAQVREAQGRFKVLRPSVAQSLEHSMHVIAHLTDNGFVLDHVVGRDGIIQQKTYSWVAPEEIVNSLKGAGSLPKRVAEVIQNWEPIEQWEEMEFV